METDRLETFSDGVFAIAITVLVLAIRAPGDTHHLLHQLLHLWPSYLAFVVSFMQIGLVWSNHHLLFGYLEEVDRTLILLNLLLLMDVVATPFVAAVLASALRNSAGEQTAVVLYGAALCVAGVMFKLIWAWASGPGDLARVEPDRKRSLDRYFLLGPAVYAVGALCGALLPALGLAVYVARFLFFWTPHRHQA